MLSSKQKNKHKTKQDKEKLSSVNDFIKEIEVTPQTTIKENVPNNKEQFNDSSNIINKELTITLLVDHIL